jgi:tRNA A-37 threonylcarbamoyl transferase component Bud32
VRNKTDNFLRGLSGCSLVLSEKNTVTKYSSSLGYNDRLLRQAKKQEYFNTLNIPNIKCPAIFSIDSSSDLSSFDMEYISGNNYISFLEYASMDYVNFFSASLISYLDFLNTTKAEYYTESDFVQICKVKFDAIKNNAENKDFSGYLMEKITSIKKPKIPITFCHGDLTLSNILFSVDSLCFLDFLDSYIESWVIDLIKIKQDLYYCWNIKRDVKDPSFRSIQISQSIWKKLETKYSWMINSDEFKILEYLNFLRIYPYLNDESDILLLNQIIKKTPIYEEFNNSNGG